MTTPQLTQPGSTGGARGAARRLTTETKSFFKTSEFWAYALVLLGILIAGNSIEGQEGGTDFFAADKVWLYITLLTIGYLISRGIAKAGVRDPYWDQASSDNGNGVPLTDRVKAAAHVLTDAEAAAQAQPAPPQTGPGATQPLEHR